MPHKTVLITGCSSGYGLETARHFHAQGWNVVATMRTPREDLLPRSERMHVVALDVTKPESITAALAAAGPIDVLVNNAGIGATGDVAANDDDEWARVLDVNVVGLARVSAAALPHLRRSSAATIVNVSSVVAAVGVPQRALYSASKGAVAAVTLAMAADHVKEGIRVNAVLPGTADTPWVGRLLDQADDPEAAGAALRARQPIGRLVSADEVAHSIVYLASPSSASTTGTLLAVDGGMASVRLPS